MSDIEENKELYLALADGGPDRDVYVLSGLPGAGKSTAADIGATMTGGGSLASGDLIREMAYEDGLEDPESEELAQYAADSRAEYGPSFVAERFVGMVSRGDFQPDYPLFIDGIRHEKSIPVLREYFDSAVTIFLEADPEIRVERLQERGRDGEDEFTLVDLMRRDENELMNLGVKTLYESDYVDHWIRNEGTQNELRAKLEVIIE